MTGTAKYQNRLELLQGTLDMLVMQALLREPMHGYAIAQVIRSRLAVPPSRPVPSTRLCIVSNARNGSSPNGS